MNQVRSPAVARQLGKTQALLACLSLGIGDFSGQLDKGRESQVDDIHEPLAKVSVAALDLPAGAPSLIAVEE